MMIIKVIDIKLSSYIKIIFIAFTSLGFTLGLILFLLGLFGQNVYANIGTLRFTGIVAGLINIVLAPLLSSIFGFFYALISYLPFKFIIRKLLKGFYIKGEFQNDNSDNIES